MFLFMEILPQNPKLLAKSAVEVMSSVGENTC
jgi:hypothetical protein